MNRMLIVVSSTAWKETCTPFWPTIVWMTWTCWPTIWKATVSSWSIARFVIMCKACVFMIGRYAWSRSTKQLWWKSFQVYSHFKVILTCKKKLVIKYTLHRLKPDPFSWEVTEGYQVLTWPESDPITLAENQNFQLGLENNVEADITTMWITSLKIRCK